MIPSGEITFLYTDIEGSTKLAQDYPHTIQKAINRHHEIMHNAIKSNNGYVFEIIGDAFCSSFTNPEDAVKAAVHAQKDLSSEKWEDAVIKARIGIHSGKSEWNGKSYTGYVTIARIQKVMSAAYGQQILISNDAYSRLKNETSSSISFRDLGERRLQDLIQPVRIFQVLTEGLREDFPPLKTLDARPNNLPVQLTSFIGREKEMSELKNLLSKSRLLTMIGPGGSGKTRLSLHVGADVIDEFEGGVWLIELASLQDPLLLINSIAHTLGLKEQPGKATQSVITDYLKGKNLLLILDNCEHVIDACAQTAEKLLKSSPGLKILATSREPLHCSGEHAYKLQSLSHHTTDEKISPDELSQFEAVKLFIDRATAVNPEFKVDNDNAPALAQICYRLDGIPLAIELAAVRIKVLSVNSICERLDNVFKLLTGGNRTALPRQQTLKALIDWSYDLLSENEKKLMQRLTIFSGGWTFEASEIICSDDVIDEYEILDLLSNLADKSLLKIQEKDNALRYSMLETIKRYGDEKLIESGDKQNVQRKHYDYFFEFTKDSEKRLSGPEQRELLKKIVAENENIRVTLRWSLNNEPDLALKLSVVLCKFWELRSYFSEALDYLQKSLEKSSASDELWKGKAIYWIGFFFIHFARYDEAKEYFKRCLEIFRKVNDREGEALTLVSFSTVALFENEYDIIEKYCNESLAISREINSKPLIARNLQNTGLCFMQQGFHDEARRKFDESLVVYREIDDPLQLAKLISNIGALEYLTGNYLKAREVLEESLQLRRELGDRQGMSIALTNLGALTYMQKDFDASVIFLEEAVRILKDLGDKRIIVTPIHTLGTIAFDKGNYTEAVKMFDESFTIAKEIADKYTLSKVFEGYAMLLLKKDKNIEACMMAAKYVMLLESSNKNIIDAEVERIKEIKLELQSKLNPEDYARYYKEGIDMSVDEAVRFVKSIDLGF